MLLLLVAVFGSTTNAKTEVYEVTKGGGFAGFYVQIEGSPKDTVTFDTSVCVWDV